MGRLSLPLETPAERARMTDDTRTPAPTGRPRKAPGELLSDGLRVRMTAAERASAEARAAQAGLPVSEFARRAIAGAKIAPPNDRAAIPPMLIAELGRVGNNLNQIAHAAHVGRELRHMAEVSLTELRALVAVSQLSAKSVPPRVNVAVGRYDCTVELPRRDTNDCQMREGLHVLRSHYVWQLLARRVSVTERSVLTGAKRQHFSRVRQQQRMRDANQPSTSTNLNDSNAVANPTHQPLRDSLILPFAVPQLASTAHSPRGHARASRAASIAIPTHSAE